MELSLVISTLGRVDEFHRLFESLLRQTHRPIELVLVDQNTDDRLAPIVQEYKDKLKITHVKTPGQKGLSRGRNAGLETCNWRCCSIPR